MKASACLFAVLVAACSFAVEPPALPQSEFADTEASGVFRRTYEIRSRQIDPSWNLVKVTRRGLGVSCENVTFSLVESGFDLTVR